MNVMLKLLEVGLGNGTAMLLRQAKRDDLLDIFTDKTVKYISRAKVMKIIKLADFDHFRTRLENEVIQMYRSTVHNNEAKTF